MGYEGRFGMRHGPFVDVIGNWNDHGLYIVVVIQHDKINRL